MPQTYSQSIPFRLTPEEIVQTLTMLLMPGVGGGRSGVAKTVDPSISSLCLGLLSEIPYPSERASDPCNKEVGG